MNKIQTGNLDIEVEYTLDGEKWNPLDGAADLFKKGLWEPGHTEVVALKFKNNGNLALKYSINMNIVEEKTGINKAGQEYRLSDYLKVKTLSQEASQIGDIQELDCEDLEKLMQLRKKMQIPGRHPGCKKCPNLGTENCRCKQNSLCADGCEIPAEPSPAGSDLVSQITKLVLAELEKK